MARDSSGSPRLHWGSILGGSFVALGAWMFFLAFGSAMGGVRPPALWTAVCALVAPILGLFCGGLVAARAAGREGRADAALRGIVLWGFAMVLGAVLIGSFGVAFVGPGAAQEFAGMPAGYAWAIAGSMLGSLIAAVLGASATSREPERSRAPTTANRGEVHL